MKKRVTQDTQLNFNSFGDLSAIDLDQSRASRKQLPNRLKINFDSSAKKNGAKLIQSDRKNDRHGKMQIQISNEDVDTDGLRINPYMISNVEGVKKSILRGGAYGSTARELNKTTEEDCQSNMLKRPKNTIVRKMLKFQNGQLVTNSQSVIDAIKKGEVHDQSDQEITSSRIGEIQVKRVALKSPPSGQIFDKPPGFVGKSVSGLVSRKSGGQVVSSGFALQNKLAKRNKGGSVGSFSQIMYKLSRPQNHDLNKQSLAFFKEDVFCSPKYRAEPEKDKKTFKVRFDGQHVLSRSICGTRNQFSEFLTGKQIEEQKKRKASHIGRKSTAVGFGGASRRNTDMQSQRGSARSTTSVFGLFKRNDSQASLASCFNPRMSADFNEVSQKGIDEHDSEANKSDSSISGHGADKSGITGKQLRAVEKLSLYQKGWQRLNKMLNRGEGLRGVSLLDNQKRFRSRKDDCLSTFYDSTQQSVNMCAQDVKRGLMIERAARDENQKFDNERCRQSFYGSLRNDNIAFVQTTRNPMTALHCRVSSRGGEQAYSTKTSLNYRAHGSDGGIDDAFSGLPAQINGDLHTRNMPHKLGVTDINFMQENQQSIMSPLNITQESLFNSTTDNVPMPFRNRRQVATRKTTQIFDGALIQERKSKAPRRTYLSKKQNNQDGQRGIYLPEVAVAIKQHEMTSEIIKRQQAAEEEDEDLDD